LNEPARSAPAKARIFTARYYFRMPT